MERKIWMALKRKRKQTERVLIRKSPIDNWVYGIQKRKQPRSLYVLQSRNWRSNKKSWIISDCLPKNNFGVRVIKKASINERVGIPKFIRKIWEVMGWKNKEDWKIKGIINVLTSSRPWE